MGGHGNILVRVYKIFAPICNAWRDTPAVAMQEGNPGVQSVADVNPHPETKKMSKFGQVDDSSQIFTKLFPVSMPQFSGRPQQFCVSWFLPTPAGALSNSLKTALQLPEFSQEGRRSYPHPAAGAFVATPYQTSPWTTNRTGEPAPSAGSRLPE